MRKILLLINMMLMTTLLFAQTTYFVATTGDDANDGTSWANAKKSIAAMVAAIADPANSQIFVKKGTYTITSTITLGATKNGLKLYGGFVGTETCLCDRTFGATSADSTVLDGNNAARVISNSGASGSKVTGIVWDGFTITRGKGASGAGMSNSYADVTIKNCIFKANVSTTTSGAMYNQQNDIVVDNCKFYANRAATNGGAILFSTKGSATVTNCTFDANTATGNGGAVVTYATATDLNTINVINSTFTRNTAGGVGGGFTTNAYTTVIVNDCTFSDNTATTTGGGIHNFANSRATITNSTFTGNIATTNGGGIYNSASVDATITNCTFTANEAQNTAGANGGGGLYSIDANPTITYCTFRGNKATNSGGGIFLYNATTTKLVNCIFVGNKANNAGGAAYISNATGKTCTPTFINCTIAGNNAPTTGGGIYNTGVASSNGTNTVITNCIIYGNSSGITNSAAAGATATVTYSNVQYTGTLTAEMDCSLSGVGNLNADPIFVGVTKTYNDAPFTEGNYALGSNSVNAVDKGLNSAISGYTTDLTGLPDSRIYNNGTVDMGAYEYHGVLPVTISSFVAGLVNNHTQLKWNVGTEDNVNHYEVERSQNGVDFLKVATVSASGSSTYHATDANPQLGINYYRLVSIDNDGTTDTYKDIQTVKVASLAVASVQVLPNPVTSNAVNVALNGYVFGNYAYKLINAAGVTVQEGNLNYGGTTLSIATNLPAGIYMLYLSNSGNVIKTKLIKQ